MTRIDRRPIRVRLAEPHIYRAELGVNVGPDEAKWVLDKHVFNRNVYPERVNLYASQMLARKWQPKATDFLAITPEDALLNGRHRLNAIIQSNVVVQLNFLLGVDKEAYAVMDRGLVRTHAHDLDVLGYADTRNLAAAAGLVYLWEAGKVDQVNGKLFKTYPVEEVLRRHPGLPDSVKWSRSLPGRALLTPRLAAYSHYRATRLDASLAADFFKDLFEGVNLSKGDGVYWLRERLIASRGSKTPLVSRDVLALTAKAWNYRRDGNTNVKCLKWTNEGHGKEPFPDFR